MRLHDDLSCPSVGLKLFSRSLPDLRKVFPTSGESSPVQVEKALTTWRKRGIQVHPSGYFCLCSRRPRFTFSAPESCKAAQRPVFWLLDHPSLQAFPTLVAHGPNRSLRPVFRLFLAVHESVAWVCSSSPVTATGSRRIFTGFPQLLRAICLLEPSMLPTSGSHQIPTSYVDRVE